MSQTSEVITWAHEAQREAFEAGPGPLCLSGGWGSAKTWLGCMKALWLSDTFPKNRGAIIRSVAKELRATTMATFYKVCDPRAYARGKRNDQDGICVLNNGSQVLFLHLEDPNIQGILRGLEINWFFIDQAEEDEQHMEENFDLLLGRMPRWDQAVVPGRLVTAEGLRAQGLRVWPWVNPGTGKPLPPPFAIIAVNPEHLLHWVYRRFHPESAEWAARYAAQGYRMIDFPTLGNRYLPEANKTALLARDDVFVQRNVYGKWGITEGTIHRVAPESLIEGTAELLRYFREACTLHRVLDHGDSAPTVCAWLAVDGEGRVFIYREYYQGNRLISQHRVEIAALSEGETYRSNLADPSIFHKTMQKTSGLVSGRYSVADEYRDVVMQPRGTALHWTPADNNELGTRNRINEYLRVDPTRRHPMTGRMGSPRLFFVQRSEAYPQGCAAIVRETQAQKRVRIGTENGKATYSDERDPRVTDHGYDVVRYGIAGRPRSGAKEPPKPPGPGTWGYETARQSPRAAGALRADA